MNQKVVFFQEECPIDLQKKINEFAEYHHIESISYSVRDASHVYCHCCCVLYTDSIL